MVPLCALSPPWWRQCFHWLSSSVAYWWKSQSLDSASLVGCRTPDVRFVRVDEVRRDSCKGGWNLGYFARRTRLDLRVWIGQVFEDWTSISVWFLSDQRSTLELPSSVHGRRWHCCTLAVPPVAPVSWVVNKLMEPTKLGWRCRWEGHRWEKSDRKSGKSCWKCELWRYQHRFLNGA